MRSLNAAAPLLMALAACESKTTADATASAADPEATATASVTTESSAGVAAGTQLPLTAQAFVDAASASDKFEIESARIMQGAGPEKRLRDFTQMMLRDHQASTNALRTAANAAGRSAFPDDQKMTDKQEVDLAALREAGSNKGELYIRQQIEAHQVTLAILKNYAASGDDQALMAFAAKSIPVVAHHLEEVRKLR